MAPPKLAADAPIVDVLHPIGVSLLVLIGRELDMSLLDRFDSFVSQRLYLDEPLRGKARLDGRLTSVAVAHVIRMVLDAGEQALSF